MLKHQKNFNKTLAFSQKILVAIILFGYLSNCIKNSESTGINFNDEILPTEVALLLPLESQNHQTNTLAIHLINSARLAAEDLKHLNLVLSVYPTSGEEIRAVYAAKTALERGAQIIIGPLFSEETAAVKAALEKEPIKIISLSNDPSVAGKNVFIMGTTLNAKANRLVKFAVSQGLERIAIIGPAGKIGKDGIASSKKAIGNNGAILTTISMYPLNIEGIVEVAPSIYAELIKSNSEAIIFTDAPTRGLGFITEQLDQLFETNNRQKPKFMGLSRWDSTKNMLDESSLNRGWFIVPDQRFKELYATRYAKVFGTNPNGMSALSYDSIALIGGILKKNGSKRTADIFQRARFLDSNGFVGINGIFRFNSAGVNERSLSIAEVKAGNIKIIDSAKKKFLKSNNNP